MEASERPQLPFDEGPGGDGSVRAIDDRLVIERLEIEDGRAARLVRERAEAGHARDRDRPRCGRDRRPGAGQRGDRRQRRLRPPRARERARRAGPQARRDARGGGGGARGADRRDLRRRAQRLGPGPDQGDRRRRVARSPRGAARRAHRRGRVEPAGRDPGPLGKAMLEAEERHRHEVEGCARAIARRPARCTARWASCARSSRGCSSARTPTSASPRRPSAEPPRGARSRIASMPRSSGSLSRAATARYTSATSAARGARRRATPWSRSAPPTAPAWARSCSRTRTTSSRRTPPGTS